MPKFPQKSKLIIRSPDLRCRLGRFFLFFSRRREQARDFVVSMDGLGVFWGFAGW